MNKVWLSKMIIVSCVLGLFIGTVSTYANAKYTKRSDKWESSFKIIHSLETSIDGQGGSSLDMKSDYGWGFNLGYNVNPHILVNFDFSSTTPNYQASVVLDGKNGFPLHKKMDLFESQFNVVYNLFASNFTPFVQAGAGWSYVDTNVPSGPAVGGCWATWLGLYCDGYQPTFNDTRFSYNAALGVRYELANSVFFRVSYKQNWIHFNHSDNASIGSYNVEIGSVF